MALTITSCSAFAAEISLLMVTPLAMLASVLLTPTPADSEIAIALSDDTAPEAAMEITS